MTFAATALLLSACQSGDARPSTPTLGDPFSETSAQPLTYTGPGLGDLAGVLGAAYDEYDDSAAMLTLVNQARCAAGLSPLVANGLLDDAGAFHSRDTGQGGYFSHISPDGLTPVDRVSATGYRWVWVGENIAAGYPTVPEAFEAWWNSAGHRANILSPDFRETGLGHVTVAGTRYAHYWAQVFGTQWVEKDLPPTTTCPMPTP